MEKQAGAGAKKKTKTNKVKGKNHRSLRKNKANSCTKNLALVGANCAGLSSRMDSFNHLLGSLCPSIFFLQETKMKTQCGWKIENGKN